MDFSLPYFTYCENTMGFIAQPFNVLTSFIYLGIAAWIWVRSYEGEPEFHQITAFLVFIHGLCSMYWHAVNIPMGLVFDIISALLLTASLAMVLCVKALKWPIWGSMLTVVIMFLSSTFLKDAGIPYLTQNGGAFLPPLFLLAFVALKLQAKNQDATIYLLSAAYTLFFGVICRSIDWAVCDKFPAGTHFISHIFAAISIFYTVKAIETATVLPKKEVERKPEKPKNILDSDLI